MATTKTATDGGSATLDIINVSKGSVAFHLLGTTPLIMNRLAEKARQQLLLPRGRMNAAEKATNLKHDPLAEFRSAAHIVEGDIEPTLLAIPSVSFKRAMATASLDLAGAKKTQINRLLYVTGAKVNVWGVPELLMAVTRSADIGKTPDIRSRPILPRWACQITVDYMVPMVKPESVARLLVAAGISVGVGDWRQEKGAGNYGLFTVVAADDPEYRDVIETGGRAAQAAAMESPAYHDRDTADLMTWFDGEMRARTARGAA